MKQPSHTASAAMSRAVSDDAGRAIHPPSATASSRRMHNVTGWTGAR